VRSGCLNSGGVTGMFCNSMISMSAIFNALLLCFYYSLTGVRHTNPNNSPAARRRREFLVASNGTCFALANAPL
jgi:hypothetical protein